MTITTEKQLRELYGWPQGRAKIKVLDRLEKHSRNFIQHSPFVVLGTYGQDGQSDTSPRGGQAGFVQVLDDQRLLIPDAKGNNRVDSLVNIVETGRLACLFLIPGIDETLRINGKASISIEEEYLARFADEKRPPKSVIVLEIEEVFLHCAKALMRSELWHDTYRQERPGFPTMGVMLNEQLGMEKSTESQEEMIRRYQADL
ncbi:MAG: pyridoxamine 5'-phosphate oxidase family protein [Bacteroidota bacterium]